MDSLKEQLAKLALLTEEEPRSKVEVDPNILSFYNHEGWQNLHDHYAILLVQVTLRTPLGEPHPDNIREFLTLLEEEIPYAKLNRT